MGDITYIGITNYQNKHIRFGIKEKDRSGHIYCIGKTGVGKSTLLQFQIFTTVMGLQSLTPTETYQKVY